MTKSIKREIFKFVIVKNFTALSISFMISVYTLFLLEKGLDLFQISILGFAYSWVVVLLQIPTGALADVWGRKKTYLLSKAILALSFLVYILSKGFYGYLIGEMLWAVASALESGCISAHIWETISNKCETEGYCKIETEKMNKRTSSIIMFSTSIVGALGGYLGALLAQKNLNLPWILSGIFVTISIIVDFLFIEKDRKREISIKEDLAKMLATSKKAISLTKENKSLIEILLIGFFARLSLTSVYNFWQAKGRDLNGGDIAVFGLIWVLIEVACSIGSLGAERLNRFVNEKSILMGAIFATTFGVLLMALTKNFVFLIAFFLILQIIVMFREYSFEIIEQKEIDRIIEARGESARATILSLFSMSSQIGISFGLLAGGKLAKEFSIDLVWYISAGLCLLLSLVVMAKKIKKTESKVFAIEST